MLHISENKITPNFSKKVKRQKKKKVSHSVPGQLQGTCSILELPQAKPGLEKLLLQSPAQETEMAAKIALDTVSVNSAYCY